ncbi:endonuclease/exonuclease/phosphatase family protein [Streptomyces sp. NPDC008313]|uniref:endonuclease/exonuclease/phosphatase family protein n=1 Tax=Streptomyces sp. NPDC008313 TaxID=3364826 RepID=UPI0036E34A92
MGTATAERTAAREGAGGRTLRSPGAAWCAGLLLAGVSAVVGFRAADSDGVTPVPQLLAFLPWLLAPTGLALLFAFLARWRVGLVWGVLALGAIAWFIEPYGRISAPTGAPLAELRVMTSDVRLGRGADALVHVIRRERPDIVFVQECDDGCLSALEDAFGERDLPYRRAAEAGGPKGSVILSRYPLRAAAGVPGTLGMPGAVADVNGHAVRLQLAHPVPPLPGRLGAWRGELGALRDYAAASDEPTVLAGDFNASQDHAAFRRVLDAGLNDGARLAGQARAPSWPARTAPALGAQIDHVLVSRDFSANRASFVRIAGSGHRALIVDVTLHRRG